MSELAAVVAGSAVEGLARLNRVDARNDPQATATMIGWLANPPWHATGAKPFYTALFRRLRETADASHAPAVKAAAKRVAKVINGKSMRTWMIEQTTKLAAQLGEAKPAIATGRTTKQARTADALLDAIYADPTDDLARQVYADALSEQGDPRGALITMQLARVGRQPTPAERKREINLLAKHLRGWLEELAGVVGSLMRFNLEVGPERAGTLRFERGFLAECEIDGSEKKVAAVASHRVLSTVEDLLLWDAHGVRVLQAHELPALRSLWMSSALVPAMLGRPFANRVRRLTLSGRDTGGSDYVEHVAACAVLPALREFELYTTADQLRGWPVDAARAALAIPTVERVELHTAGSTGAYVRKGKRWRFEPVSNVRNRAAFEAVLR